jgi:hypothetical protein
VTNLADLIGIPRTLENCADLLSKDMDHSTLVLSTAGWRVKVEELDSVVSNPDGIRLMTDEVLYRYYSIFVSPLHAWCYVKLSIMTLGDQPSHFRLGRPERDRLQ